MKKKKCKDKNINNWQFSKLKKYSIICILLLGYKYKYLILIAVIIEICIKR